MGDAVGRLRADDPDDVIEASEPEMVANAANVPIDSDVLIASHHGADNGTAGPFIDAVTPTFVIFSAGHAHGHPRASTAARLLGRGIAVNSGQGRAGDASMRASARWRSCRQARPPD